MLRPGHKSLRRNSGRCLFVLNTLHLSFTVASVSAHLSHISPLSSMLSLHIRLYSDAQLATLYQIATPAGRQDSNVITFSEP